MVVPYSEGVYIVSSRKKPGQMINKDFYIEVINQDQFANINSEFSLSPSFCSWILEIVILFLLRFGL